MGDTQLNRPAAGAGRRLAAARACLGRGEFGRAESHYRDILAADDTNSDAYHGLGLIAYQTKNYDHAVDLIGRAVAKNPEDPEALNNFGNALSAIGRPTDALNAFQRAVSIRPEYPEGLNNLANMLRRLERRAQAVEVFGQAVSVAPEFNLARMNLARTLIEIHRFDEAIEVLESRLEQEPDDFKAHFYIGIAHSYAGDFEASLEPFTRCIELDPNDAEAHFRRGLAQMESDQKINAQVSYQIALNIEPEHVAARNNLANIFSTVGRYDEAIAEYELALETMPSRVDVMDNLAVALRKAARFDEAFAVFDRAIGIDPTYASLYNDLGAAHQCVGNMDKAAECYLQALEIAPDETSAEKNYLFALVNLPNLSPEERFERHRVQRGRHFNPEAHAKTFSSRSRDTNRRLRVGYLSSDFRTHVVSLSTLPIFEHHDHSAFEIFAYAEVMNVDKITDVFKEQCDHWRSITSMTDEEAARQIEEDEIDILVCLAGRFDQNRSLIPTFRPAPIQVSFHDVATTGLDDMDYWFTDSLLHPTDTPERFTEELYRLPVYYQYAPQENMPPTGSIPADENGYVTFGSFNKPEKLNEQVVDLWSKVLRAVPNSKLLLKYFNLYREDSQQKHWISRFEEHGISGDRLILQANTDSRHSHLGLYHQMDIALDPFPFNGATTTYEALSMGVPVITLRGRDFVARVGASLVTHTGHPEFVGANEDDYITVAADLAGDLNRLRMLRATLREDLETSPLIDGKTHTQSLETAYRDMWSRWCAN